MSTPITGSSLSSSPAPIDIGQRVFQERSLRGDHRDFRSSDFNRFRLSFLSVPLRPDFSSQTISRSTEKANGILRKFQILESDTPLLYGAPLGLVNFDTARRSQIDLTEECHSQIGKADDEAADTREGPVDLRSAEQVSNANRARREFGKVAACQNSSNLTARRIVAASDPCPGLTAYLTITCLSK